MTKIFLPPLDSMWRLSKDFHFSGNLDKDVAASFGVPEYMHTIWPEFEARRGDKLYTPWSDEDRAAYDKWVAEYYDERNIMMPEGTVIVFDRYHVSHSGEDQITVRILSSPDSRIHPKKLGGKGKGKLRLYLTLADVNRLEEMDEVPNVVSDV